MTLISFLTRFMKHFEDLADAKEEKFGNPAVYSEICFQITLDLRDPTFQKLLYLDVAANVVADISEAPKTNTNKGTSHDMHDVLARKDWTSLEKVGILRKGTLHPRTECARESRESRTRKKNKKINRFTGHSRAVLYPSILKKTKMETWTKTKTRSERKVTEVRYYAIWCQLVLAVVEIVVTKIKAKRLADGEQKRHDGSTSQPRLTEPRKRLQSLTRQKKCCERRPWQLASSFHIFLILSSWNLTFNQHG